MSDGVRNFIFYYLSIHWPSIGRVKVYQMRSTKGDKMYFDGAESCYKISGQNKTLRVNDSPSAILSLKRIEPPPAVLIKMEPLFAELCEAQYKPIPYISLLQKIIQERCFINAPFNPDFLNSVRKFQSPVLQKVLAAVQNESDISDACGRYCKLARARTAIKNWMEQCHHDWQPWCTTLHYDPRTSYASNGVVLEWRI